MRLFLSLLIGVFITTVSLFGAQGLTIVNVDVVKKHFDDNSALFLDARPMKLFQAGTITGSLYMDYKEYDKLKKFLPADKKLPIIAFCNGIKCEHSDHLAELLKKDGYTNVLVYKGGYPEWLEKKYPVSGALKECKDEGVYTPKTKAVAIKGATVHLIEGDAKMIDQFWFSEVLKNGVPVGVQMIDIRKIEQFKEGHIQGAINAPFENGKLDESKLAKDKLNVIYCNTGMQSTEAISSLKDYDGKVVYFDATIDCKGNDCKITPNELLDF